MRKTNRILCAIIFMVGALGTIIETCRLVNYSFTMKDDQWTGEYLMLNIFGVLIIGSAIYTVSQQFYEE